MVTSTTTIANESINAGEGGKALSTKPSSLLFDESDKDSTLSTADDWQVTNDGVMGGLSQGSVSVDNKALVFSGKLSTENSGGFTSAFKKIPSLPERVNSVTITVQGDGKPYQLRVRSKVSGYDLAYKINFETEVDTLNTYTFMLADFEASFRGRIINNAPLLTANIISHVGFLLSSKQASDFSLSVYDITFL